MSGFAACIYTGSRTGGRVTFVSAKVTKTIPPVSPRLPEIESGKFDFR